MSQSALHPELQEELEAIAESEGCELHHVEFKGGTLRLVLDRPDGVTLEHCQSVSRQASALLDVADFGSARYTLEVSSPGLDRPLRNEKDYERFAGSLDRVTLRDPGDGARRTIVGRLGELQDGVLTLIEERPAKKKGRGKKAAAQTGSAEEEAVAIPLEAIEKARLEIEL